MSGTRFSGIAVAAANRKALANQEREAALCDASLTHKLSSREEALLARSEQDEARVTAKKAAQAALIESQRKTDAYLKDLKHQMLSAVEDAVEPPAAA